MIREMIRNPYLYVILISYYCVWLIWDAIKLPYHNPAGIISALQEIGYNPTNNILRFVIAILLPPLVCLFVWAMLNKKPKKIWRNYEDSRYAKTIVKISVIVVALALCVGMGISQNSTNPDLNPTGVYGGPYTDALVDTFHEGETLGPALAYEQPQLAPYRDFVMIHGVFQDALRSVIAFKLFGTSIGATRAFTVILGITAFISYLVLLFVLFRKNVFKAVTGLWVLALLMLPAITIPFIGTSIYGVQFPFRDIATVIFLILAIIGLRLSPSSPRKLAIVSGLIGLVAIAGFANSIDRALYIGALSAVWLILLLILTPLKKFLKNVLLPYAVGAVAGAIVLGVALKWAYPEFLQYVLHMTKYKEYLDGIIFNRPNIAMGIILLLVAILITVFGSVLVKALNSSKVRGGGVKARLLWLRNTILPIVQAHGVTILLFFTAAFFLRSAIGRSLPDHWVYSVQWLYLLLVYTGVNYLYKFIGNKKGAFHVITVLVLCFTFVFYAATVKKIDIKRNTFPISIPDEKFMRPDYIDTAKYLKENLKPDESFVTLTSEWSWHYFVDKPSPIRWAIIWYAFTKDQRVEIAQDIENNSKIKYILTNNNWTSNIDYVPNETRFPEVYSVLYANYTPHTGIGQQTIWIRK